MIEVVSVRFKRKGKVYYFAPEGNKVNAGDNVIVETSKGIEFAECTAGNHFVEDGAVVPPIRPVVRIATPEDVKRAEDNKAKEEMAYRACMEKIEKHKLDMKLVDVEYSFDGSKLLFFFTSDGRVDFRELVKDLASEFKTRIELRQIGVRDEARILGGLGICGRPFCCAQFLDDFQPVSIKMAKVQGLSLNPTKISGTCGRLMCCLKYEQDAYESLVKDVPKVDSFVNTPKGRGLIVDVNLLRRNVRVRLEDQRETAVCTFEADEVEVLGGKAKRAEYLAAKAEGKEVDETPYIPPKRTAPVSEECPVLLYADGAGSADGSSGQAEAKTDAAGDKPEVRKSRRRRRKHGGSQNREQPKPAAPQAEKAPEQAKQEKPAAEKTQENKPSKSNSHRRHRKPDNRPKPENGKENPGVKAPQAQSAQNKEASPDKEKSAGEGNRSGGSKGNNRHRNYRRYRKPNGGTKPAENKEKQ